MLQMRRLNHFGTANVWSMVIYVIFSICLICSAYMFWWHNRTYVSYIVEESEEENEEV